MDNRRGKIFRSFTALPGKNKATHYNLFKSKAVHIGILNSLKGTLNYINEYLPFAELVPLKENKGINIINTVTPKQVQIGSSNDFDGNINIGNEGEIEDGN